jgi:hypothetical protein
MRAWYIKHVFAIPSSTYSGSSWHDDVPPRLCQSRSCCGSFYVKDVQKETIQEVMNATGITDLQAWGGDRLTYHIYRIVCVWHVSYVHQSPIMYSWYCTCMHACMQHAYMPNLHMHHTKYCMHACVSYIACMHACVSYMCAWCTSLVFNKVQMYQILACQHLILLQSRGEYMQPTSIQLIAYIYIWLPSMKYMRYFDIKLLGS